MNKLYGQNLTQDTVHIKSPIHNDSSLDIVDLPSLKRKKEDTNNIRIMMIYDFVAKEINW